MSAPTVQSFKDLIPRSTDSMCESLVRAGQFDLEFYNFYSWMFKEDGSFTDAFKTSVCAVQCVKTSSTTTHAGTPTSTTTTTTAACVEGASFGIITPSISSAAVSLWSGGVSFAPGYYRVYYVGGAVKFSSSTTYSLNRVDGTAYKIIPGLGAAVEGPVISYAQKATQAEVETANSGAYRDFYHAGGPIGMRLDDTGAYTDNTISTTPPSFSLTSLCSASDDSNQNVTINAEGVGSPYSSDLVISGLGTSITDINVRITAFSHSLPDDVQLLLESPSGEKVVLMSHCGGATAIDPYSPVDLTFDDAGGSFLPDNTALSSGTFKPTQFGSPAFPSPAPSGPWASALSEFTGIDPNGTWKLWVNDSSAGNSGRIGKWELIITAS